MCVLAQHRLRGVAEVAAVRVRVIAWVGRSGHSTTLRAYTWRDTIDLHDDRHARGIACAVMLCLTVLLHGPVKALTDIPRCLRGGDGVGGAEAACCGIRTCPGYAHPRSVRYEYAQVAVESALTYG